MMHQAVRIGDIEMMRRAILKCADVDSRGPDGCTALHVAVSDARDDVVQLLVNAGANVNLESLLDMTPLYIAASHSGPAVVEVLLRAGATQHTRGGEFSKSPLHQAALYNQIEVVRLLLEADPEAARLVSDVGEVPLHLAAERGNCEIIEMLIDHSDVNKAKPHNGRTPLHEAFQYGGEAAALLLLRNGAKINFVTTQGQKPSEVWPSDREMSEELKQAVREAEKATGRKTKAARKKKQR